MKAHTARTRLLVASLTLSIVAIAALVVPTTGLAGFSYWGSAAVNLTLSPSAPAVTRTITISSTTPASYAFPAAVVQMGSGCRRPAVKFYVNGSYVDGAVLYSTAPTTLYAGRTFKPGTTQSLQVRLDTKSSTCKVFTKTLGFGLNV